MSMRRKTTTALLFLALLGLATAAGARDYGFIQGRITAERNTYNPDRGAWRYTFTVSWQSSTQHAISHLGLLLGLGGCTCEDLAGVFLWDDPNALFHERHCPDIESKFECHGDPGLETDDPVYKFEFVAVRGCDPQPSGHYQVQFLSDLPPYPITRSNRFLTAKFGQERVDGEITGVFPALQCNPIASETVSWGQVKAGYLP